MPAMEKQERGYFSEAFEESLGVHCVKWFDNAVVTMLSNCAGSFLDQQVERFSRRHKKKIYLKRPHLIKLSNVMGGVDLVDSAVATYQGGGLISQLRLGYSWELPGKFSVLHTQMKMEHFYILCDLSAC